MLHYSYDILHSPVRHCPAMSLDRGVWLWFAWELSDKNTLSQSTSLVETF